MIHRKWGTKIEANENKKMKEKAPKITKYSSSSNNKSEVGWQGASSHPQHDPTAGNSSERGTPTSITFSKNKIM